MQKKPVKKAVIPAAGLGTRFLPATKAIPKEMLPIVDIPTVQYIVEEAVQSGIEEILIITNSNKHCMENHFDKNYELEARLLESNKQAEAEMIDRIANLANIYYVRQKEPKGLGHAILCAKSFIGNDPFAVLLGDDVVINEGGEPALRQLINAYDKIGASIVGVQQVAESQVHQSGIVAPSVHQLTDDPRLRKLYDMGRKAGFEGCSQQSGCSWPLCAEAGNLRLSGDPGHRSRRRDPADGCHQASHVYAGCLRL